MKKILILGMNGFIGKNMYEYFYKKKGGDIITAPSKSELDVSNYENIYKYLVKGSFDIILNCLDSQPPDYMEKRLRMFENLANCCSLYGKMIYFGTGAEYGKDSAISEVLEQDFDRKIPSDTYGLCMHLMSEMAMKSSNIYNFRLFGIFGKYEKWQGRFISNAICKALYGYPITIRQEAIFDYLYIDDLCKIVELAINTELKYHDYNCTSGQKFKLTELASMVQKCLEVHVPIFIAKGGMGKEYTASNKRICAEMPNIQFQCIDISISQLANYYKENLSRIDKISLLYQS